MGAAPCFVFRGRGFAVPQKRHELGVVPSFQFCAALGSCQPPQEHEQ